MTEPPGPQAAWVQLVDDEDGGLTVIELDDAAVEAAPVVDLPLQLAVALTLGSADPTGQPYDDEHEALLAWQRALEAELGADGRVVASITAGGVRELLAYVRSESVLDGWDAAPPEAFASHEAEVLLQPDPDWTGLRQIAGLADGAP